MGTKVRIGDGQNAYKDISYLVGDVSKSRLDELANELANETILYVSNTTGAVKYKGERGEKNSVAKVLDYTPRPIDLNTGIIEDVINVNNDKVTSNYQYLHVNKKLVPFETSLEEPVKLQTIFELYVDDELVVDITNAWLAGKDTTDREFSPTPYTVSGPYEYKSMLNTTGEEQVQYRYYTIQIKDDDGKIRDIIGMTSLPPIYYIYDNENIPNINYQSYGPFYFIDNFATLFDSYYLDSLPLYIRTVHFDGVKSTFKFSSTMPKIDTNPEMVEYTSNGVSVCSKYPIGSTNGEDFGLTNSKLKNKNYNTIFDDTKLKFNSYSDAKKFFSENIVATPELANLVNFNNYNTLKIDIENLKIIKTSNNTFYIEHPELPVKSPVHYIYYKSYTRYAVIPNITKIEGYAGVIETHLYSNITDAIYFNSKTYINQELAKAYFGDYPYPKDKFKTPFTLDQTTFIYNENASYYANTYSFVVKNKTVNNSLFDNYCFVKIYYNDYIGGTLCRAYSGGNKTYLDLAFSVIDSNNENNKTLIPDYITIDGKQYDVTNNGTVFTDIGYKVFIENIEYYNIEAFFTGKTYETTTTPLKRIYFDVDYFNNSLNKVTLSTYEVFSFVVENANENSIRSFKADITNVNITKADSTHPDLISYKDASSNYIRLNLNEKKYIEEYNAQWDSYSAANRPKITIYFGSNEHYYRVDKYIDSKLVTTNNVMSTESDKLVLSVPFEIGKTLVSVTPEHSINENAQYVFDISTGTADNPVVIELRYTTDDTSENAKIWPLQTVEDYTYGWLVNGETIVERQTNTNAGNIVFALSGWNTNEGTSSAYNEQSTIEQQPWFEHYWALKASAKYHSIGKDGEKIEGCPTYFEFENAKSGDIIQIFYYNENNVEIAKSPIVNVI